MPATESTADCTSEDYLFIDLFQSGELLDHHTDSLLTQDELIDRLQSAIDFNKKINNSGSGAAEDTLYDLLQPKLTWQDFARNAKAKITASGNKNNWTSPKRKPLFSGLYIPKKIGYKINFLLAYDCSASMSKNQIMYGISQAKALDVNARGYCLPWDHEPHFDSMIKIEKADHSHLRMAKYKGGGGTRLSPLFESLPKEIGHVDIMIIVSDFHLSDYGNIKNIIPPKNTEVIFLSVNGNPNFRPPFGRLFNLFN